MTTIRIQVRDEIVERLNAAPPIGVPAATKRRWVPGQQITGPSIAVFFDIENDSQPGGSRGAITNRSLQVIVQCLTVVKDPADIDDAVEVLLAYVSNTINQPLLSKPSVIMSVDEVQTKWEAEQAGSGIYVSAATRFAVEFQTKRGDVSSRS